MKQNSFTYPWSNELPPLEASVTVEPSLEELVIEAKEEERAKLFSLVSPYLLPDGSPPLSVNDFTRLVDRASVAAEERDDVNTEMVERAYHILANTDLSQISTPASCFDLAKRVLAAAINQE